jgi:hypothetical protein
MQFLSGGSVVQFAGGETVTCNVALPFNGLVSGYYERVSTQAPGGTYRFVYNRSGIQTCASRSPVRHSGRSLSSTASAPTGP